MQMSGLCWGARCCRGERTTLSRGKPFSSALVARQKQGAGTGGMKPQHAGTRAISEARVSQNLLFPFRKSFSKSSPS